MRHYKHILELTKEEQQALIAGTKSRSGFTVRRSQMLLLSAEGLGCPTQKSNGPHRDHRAFDAAGLKRLEELVRRSPRDSGFETSQWTLVKLAQACFQERIVQRPISCEPVRQGLCKLGIEWKTARQRITSHDPRYAANKTS